MTAALQTAYPWLKALHVISVIAWMAGLLYLPRLFVYHCRASAGSEMSETFKIMEHRLLRAIMTPAMVASWIFGLAMLAGQSDWLGQGGFHVKLLALVVLTGIHVAMARWRRQFADDANSHGERFYRVVNEVPTVLMVVIVAMAIVKPF